MPRVKRGTVRRAKRKKLLGLAKGYYANKSKLYRAAKESVDTALKYAFVGRRRKKRDFRRLWVIRINAAAREHGLTYGQFINGLKNAGVTLDRKSLSELAIASPAAFATLATQARAAAKTAGGASRPSLTSQPSTVERAESADATGLTEDSPPIAVDHADPGHDRATP
jgi:large subunit ribosomal protein L20